MDAMSSLSDKLRSLGVQLGAENLSRSPGYNHQDPLSFGDRYPGFWQRTRSGSVFVVRKHYPDLYLQGNISIYPEHPLDIIGSWAGSDQLGSIPLEKFLFIDTETTGLSGGTGTYTFLIGVGKFSSGEFEISQFLMSDPAEEPAQLAALENYLASGEVIVSYNGKAFDLPRLRTRFRAHGWPPPLSDIIHIDLLHLMRRLYAPILPNCTLGTIEHELLGFQRGTQDIPGWQVADLYFEYLHSKDPESLAGVMYHNEMDVVSMPAVLNLAAAFLDRPLQSGPRTPASLYSAAQFYQSMNRLDVAEKLYRSLLTDPVPLTAPGKAGLMELSFLYKKQGKLKPAAALWEQAARSGAGYACVELAKYHEHTTGLLSEAVHWTLTAQGLAQSGPDEIRTAESSTELEHRLTRLKDKLGRRRRSKET